MSTGRTQCILQSTEEAELKFNCMTFYQTIKTSDGGGDVYSILILQYEDNEYIEHDFIYDVTHDFSEAAQICAMLSGASVTTASARDVITDYITQNYTVN